MGNLNEFFRDLGRNAYGLGENVASLGSAAIAEPVAGFAAMYDPTNGAAAIREGMTYTPRTQAGQMYQQGAARTLGEMVKPAMPVIDTWQRGVDIAGGYSPMAGAMLRTVPAAIGVAMGAKPALQTGRQVSNSLGAMQARMIANANAPRTLNTGYMGQRGAIGTLSTDDDLRALARFNQMNDVYKFDNSHEYYDPIDKLVARNLSDDAFDFMELPTSYGKMSITPSAKEKGKWQVTQWAKDGNPLSDSGNLTKEKALRVFFEDSRPELLSPPKRPLTEFEQAHLLAQQRAALPVSQGGLGLAPDNTAMDRARAMGFDVDNRVYHGTNSEFDSFGNDALGLQTSAKSAMAGHFFTDNPLTANSYNFVNYFEGIPEKYITSNGIGRQLSKKAPKEYFDLLDKRTEATYAGASDARAQLKAEAGAIVPPGRPYGTNQVEYGKLYDFVKKYAPDSVDFKNITPENIVSIRDKIIGTHRRMGEADVARMIVNELSAQRGGIISSLEVGASPRTIPTLIRKEKLKTAYGAEPLPDITKKFTKSKATALLIKDILDGGPISNHYVIKDPKDIRSRFAAFDPFNRESSNLLAQSAKFAPAATLGALMANEKRKDKRN